MTEPKRKPILCLDFDGVINSYESGWQGAANIPDDPVPGAMKFIVEATELFTVAIYSSRSHQPGGIDAMKNYVEHHIKEACRAKGLCSIHFTHEVIEWPEHKPAAMITLDDRALPFTGTWPDVDSLIEFQPWYKESPTVEDDDRWKDLPK